MYPDIQGIQILLELVRVDGGVDGRQCREIWKGFMVGE